MELTCKQKAELTYSALQKRKADKKRKNEYEADLVHISLLNKCKKMAPRRCGAGRPSCRPQY